MHNRICAKSHPTRRIVLQRPVFHSSSLMEMVVVDDRPFVDAFEMLVCREWGGVRVKGGGLWERSILCGVYVRACVRACVGEEDDEVGGMWRRQTGEVGTRCSQIQRRLTIRCIKNVRMKY